MSAQLTEAARESRIAPEVWKIAGVVMLGPLMAQLDSTVVNVSLAALADQLHTTLTTIQWVSSGYLLALALTLPLSGWLVDRIGAKRVYLICFSVFTLTSLLCGAANSASSLILFRALQGAAAGVLTPMSQMMMARVAGRHLARVMSVAVMPVMIGPIFGPTLAGFILQHAGWPWIFFINLPVGILAILLAWHVLPRDDDQRNRRSFDLLGFLLLSPALVMLLHSLESLAAGLSTGWWTELELLVSLVLLAAFLWHGLRRGNSALVDLHLFGKKTFAAAAATQFLSNSMTYGGQMLFPLYLLMAEGRTPSSAGILLATMGLGLICAFPILGRVTDRFGPKRVSTAGTAIALAGTLPFALLSGGGLSTATFCLIIFVRGFGLGFINIPSISAAYASTPKESLPIATTTLNIVQRLGGPVGTTLLALWLHASLAVHQADIRQAFSSTFWLFCFIHALGVPATLCLPWKKASQ